MFNLDSTKKLYPLWTTLIGLISYVITGFIINLFISNDEMLLLLLCIGGAIAGVLLGLLLGKGKATILIAISSAVGLTLSLVVAFALGYILPSSMPFLGEYGTGIVSSVIMLIIFATLMAPSLNELKAIPCYITVGGFLGILFGAFSVFTLLGEGYIPAIMAPFGIAIGLSYGLYAKRYGDLN
jgi:hypothetical protein